jgi:hypothetical protein
MMKAAKVYDWYYNHVASMTNTNKVYLLTDNLFSKKKYMNVNLLLNIIVIDIKRY